MPTITIRRIAEQTGLSKSTVAAALKGDRRYSSKTITIVKKAAKKLGYRPNPLVTAGMMRIRDSKRFDSDRATIGYLSDVPMDALIEEQRLTADHPKPNSRLGYIGAKERAHELGFGLDFIHYTQPSMSPKRLRSIVQTRGILGLIIAPPRKPQVELELSWREFAVVCIGFSVLSPKFDRVGFNHHEAITEICGRMWQKGRRRLGLVLSQDYDARVSFVTRAAFLRWQSDLDRESVRIPVALGKSKKELEAWQKRYEPDAIIAHGEGILEMLDQPEFRKYPSTEIVSLTLMAGFEKWGGYDMSLRILASSAVNMLAGKLYRNDFGLPSPRQTVLVLGAWNEGITAR